MFFGKTLSDSLSFTLSTWISLEQKHCHFIKCLLWCVFVSDSCYLRIGCHSCSTVGARFPLVASPTPSPHPLSPALLRPALPITLLSPSQRCGRTTPAASPRREGRDQGRLSDMLTQWITVQKKPLRVVAGKTSLFSKDLLSLTFTSINPSTRWHCVRPFLYMWGFF